MDLFAAKDRDGFGFVTFNSNGTRVEMQIGFAGNFDRSTRFARSVADGLGQGWRSIDPITAQYYNDEKIDSRSSNFEKHGLAWLRESIDIRIAFSRDSIDFTLTPGDVNSSRNMKNRDNFRKALRFEFDRPKQNELFFGG